MQRDPMEMIIDLEWDLVDGYEQLNRLARLRRDGSPFDLLVRQSRGHAESLAAARAAHPEPRLDAAAVGTLQQRLKESVFHSVVGETDVARAHEMLADAEHTVGRLYETIAAHCRRMAAHHAALAERIAAIAEDEFGHEKVLRREAARLRAGIAAPGAAPPVSPPPAAPAPAPPGPAAG